MPTDSARFSGFLTEPQAASGFLTRWLLLIAACAPLLVPLAGCGRDKPEPRQLRRGVKMSEVPEAVLAAAREKLPEVEFSEAWQNLDRGGKLESYEVRGRVPATGKIREVRVSTSGEILEME